MAAQACSGGAWALGMAAGACPSDTKAFKIAVQGCLRGTCTLEMAARSHCSKKLLAVALCSATPLLCSPLHVHGYARVHTSIYIYRERERERGRDINIDIDIDRSEGFSLREYVIPARVDGGWILQENSSVVVAAVVALGGLG